MHVILQIIKYIIPVKIEFEISTIFTGIGSIFIYMTGSFDKLIETLLIFMLIDYISGAIASYKNPERNLSSRLGLRVILKNIMILLLVATANFIDYAIGQTIVRSTIVLFFIGNEGLSIIENAASAGLPIPEKLRESLKDLIKEKNERKWFFNLLSKKGVRYLFLVLF